MMIYGCDDKQCLPRIICSLLPSASADGLKDLEAKPLPLWTLVPFIYYI